MKYFIKGFKQGLTYFGNNISIIVNSILLTIVYILGVGITSLIAKIFGKHFLVSKLDKNAASYWQDLNLKKKDIKEYLRQF